MANRLITWAQSQRVGDAIAKAILVRLADAANDAGTCFPKHATLSADTEVPRRTLQRKIDLLVERGFVEVEVRKRPKVGGQSSNLYRLRAAPEFLRASGDDAERCATVAHRAAPSCDAGAAPRVAHPYEPSLEPSEDCNQSSVSSEREAFDRVVKAWSSVNPDRVAPVEDWLDWLKALAGGYSSLAPDLASLERACARYLASIAEGSSRHCRAFGKWLRDERFTPWLVPGRYRPYDTAHAVAQRFPSERVRSICVAARGDDWTRSYLDPCGWDEDEQMILPHLPFARDKLLAEMGHALTAAGIAIGMATKRAAA